MLLRAAGVTTRRSVPRFATRAGLRRSDDPSVAGARDRAPAETTVVVWPDSFTEAFSPASGAELVRALSALGESVAVPSGWACCGRTLYDSGMLDLAKRSLRRLVSVLSPWVDAGVPVVVPEPSCLAAFRDELPALLPGDPRANALASLARSPAEHILEKGLQDRLGGAPVPEGSHRRAVLHPHCHQRSVVGTNADQAVLAALGYEVEVLDAGCCGLAGSYGFDPRTEAISRKIGDELWLPKVRAALAGDGTGCGPLAGGDAGSGAALDGALLVCDGFSCRTQLEHLGPELVGSVATLPGLLALATGCADEAQIG